MTIKEYLTQPFGLGDLAYYAFRPVVYIIDGVWGTDMRHCDLCKLRRLKWNEYGHVPSWFAWSLIAASVALLVL
jgi:hypothetical protein